MKNFMLAILLVTFTMGVTPSAFSASSELTWKDYKSYRDINSGTEGKKQFRERTFKEFEKHFAKLAETLPKDQQLKIEVTDVDLAGDTNAAGINRIRIIKDLYIPRMEFSYQLLDSNSKVVLADEVKLKDMNFMSNSQLKYRNKPLGYEKKMLDDWFKTTFKALIVSQ
jgi:hypothetical protein